MNAEPGCVSVYFLPWNAETDTLNDTSKGGLGSRATLIVLRPIDGEERKVRMRYEMG